MIRVLIADDHPLVRVALRQVLVGHRDIELAGEAADGRGLVDRVAATQAHVLVLDISMPDADFLDIVKATRERHPSVQILVLSAHPEEQWARRALRAGAAGYITKDRSTEELVDAIRKVVRGERYVSSTLAAALADELATGRPALPHEALTNREFQVMRLLASGRTVGQVAAELDLSVKTVSTHRERLLRKMGLQTTAELTRYAIEHHLA